MNLIRYIELAALRARDRLASQQTGTSEAVRACAAFAEELTSIANDLEKREVIHPAGSVSKLREQLRTARALARTWHAACDQRSPEWYADAETIRRFDE